MSVTVRDNAAQHRFELELEGGTAFATYRQSDGVVSILHTEVPRALNGQGHGSELVQGSLELIRERGLKVRPMCAFVSYYMRAHPEQRDLLA